MSACFYYLNLQVSNDRTEVKPGWNDLKADWGHFNLAVNFHSAGRKSLESTWTQAGRIVSYSCVLSFLVENKDDDDLVPMQYEVD